MPASCLAGSSPPGGSCPVSFLLALNSTVQGVVTPVESQVPHPHPGGVPAGSLSPSVSARRGGCSFQLLLLHSPAFSTPVD